MSSQQTTPNSSSPPSAKAASNTLNTNNQQQQQQQQQHIPQHQYETIESLRAQLALAQENYKRQIKNLRHDKENLQNEIISIKADCSLIATRLDDALVRARKAEESEKQMKKQVEIISQESKEKMEALRERQCDAPAIDESIFKNYKELRTLLFDRCGAEFMSVEEQWRFARSTPLAVLEMTREWFWKFTECFETVSQQVDMQRAKWKDEKDELMGVIEMLRSNGNENSLMNQFHHHSAFGKANLFGGGHSPSSPSAHQQNANKSKVMQANSAGSGKNNNSNKNTSSSNNAIDDENSENVDQLQQRIGVLRRECALSKSESLRAHKAVASAEQKQRHLQQMLEKAHKQLQEAVEATSSSTVRKQVDEVKKQMRLAMNQKDDELSSLKVQFEKDVVALTKQIAAFSDQTSKADSLHTQLTVKRQQVKDLRNELARTDARALREHKQKADREILELRSHTSNLEQTVDTLKLRLAAAKQLAVDAKSKYSALFDAHLQEAKSRQAEAAKKKMKQIRRDVVGSDSALTKYHFEQKYQALSQELANTQQKLKRLIMIAHHDQVAHDAEIEQMQMHAVAYYEKQQRKEEDEMWSHNSQDFSGQALHQYSGASMSKGGGRRSPSPILNSAGGSSRQHQQNYQQQQAGRTRSPPPGQHQQKHVTDRNLFHAEGALREQLQQNVIVGEGKTTVEEIARVVGEGVVQDTRSWTPQPRGASNDKSDGSNPMTKMNLNDGKSAKRALGRGESGSGVSFGQTMSASRFEVSSRTALAASSAKQKSDLTEYFDEREKQDVMKQQKKVQLSTMGHRSQPVGDFASPGGLHDSKEALAHSHSAQKPPRPSSSIMMSNSNNNKPTQNSVQFFIEGSTSPLGVRDRRVL